MWRKHCGFPHKILRIAIMFPYMVFFMIFSKIIFVDFIREMIVAFITKHCGLL